MTPNEHEEIQELLAGHALHALDEGEAAHAEGLLLSHVPACADCRAALDAFELLAGDLALATRSRRPPHTLGARIRRDTSVRRIATWAGRLASAAVAASLIGVLGWNMMLTGRVTDSERRTASTMEVLSTVAHPESRVVPLSAERSGPREFLVTAAFVPGRHQLYVFGYMPEPAGGSVYQIWLIQNGVFHDAGTFTPKAGQVLVRISADPTTYDGVLITEEPGHGSRVPSNRRVVTATF